VADNVSNLGDFKTSEQLADENVKLRRELKAAIMTVDKLLKDMSKKTDEIKHLQSLVSQVVPVIKAPPEKSVVQVSPEVETAEIQLERLRQAARTRPLTLEEVRMFDLLVKNKRLSQDESTINLSKASYRDVSNDDLAQIAAKDVEMSDESDA
jgi:hypothetical protein